MSDPVVFISHFRLKEGALEAFERLNREIAGRLEADKPRTLLFLSYMDSARTRVSFLHVFADEESMDLHFEGSDDRSQAALKLMIPAGWDVYGQPSADALANLRRGAEAAGVALTVQPAFVAGFLRAAS
jgi:hypothetical protein